MWNRGVSSNLVISGVVKKKMKRKEMKETREIGEGAAVFLTNEGERGENEQRETNKP